MTTHRTTAGATRLRLRPLRDKTETVLSWMLDAPVRIAFPHEVASSFRPTGLRAYTGRFLGNLLGFDGAGMIVDAGDIIRHVRDLARYRPIDRRAMVGREFLGTVAHEAAHLICLGWLHPGPAPGPELAEAMATATACLCSRPLPDLSASPCPWMQHNGSFIRVFLHLAYRLARALRVWLLPDFAGESFGLSPSWRYQSALDNEPEKLRHLPVTAIPDIAPPAAFVELWRADLRGWFLGLASPSKIQTAAFVDGTRLFNSSTQNEEQHALPTHKH